MKVAGFGVTRLSKISPDKAKLAQAGGNIDPSSKFFHILKPFLALDFFFDIYTLR